MDAEILTDVLLEAGITIDINTWDLSDPTEFKRASLLAQGVVAFGQKIAEIGNVGIESALAHLMTLIGGGVTWYRDKKGPLWPPCRPGAACALESDRIGFYDSLFTGDDAYIRATAIHELAHRIDIEGCGLPWFGCQMALRLEFDAYWSTQWNPFVKSHFISDYAKKYPWEYWAEAVTVWVYGSQRMTCRVT